MQNKQFTNDIGIPFKHLVQRSIQRILLKTKLNQYLSNIKLVE